MTHFILIRLKHNIGNGFIVIIDRYQPTKPQDLYLHYSDDIMSAMAFQITNVSTVSWTVCLGADEQCIKALRHWPLWWEFTDDLCRGLVGQQRGKCSIWWRHHVQPWHSPKIGLTFGSTLIDVKAIISFYHPIFGCGCFRIAIAVQMFSTKYSALWNKTVPSNDNNNDDDDKDNNSDNHQYSTQYRKYTGMNSLPWN